MLLRANSSAQISGETVRLAAPLALKKKVPMRLIAQFCVYSLSLISAANAQITATEIEANITWQLDTNGSLMIAPDPWSASGEHARVLRESLLATTSYANLGTWGMLIALAPGCDDIASLTDGERLFKRIGYGLGDAKLLQRIRGSQSHVDTKTAQRVQLERIIAMRIAQKRELRAAIGVLKLVTKDDRESESLRKVARDVIRALKGETPAPLTVELESLRTVLARVPNNSEAVIVVDQRALPSARSIMPMIEPLAMGITKSVLRKAGGTVSPAHWTSARMVSCQPGVLPYELALRFGNFSLHRTVVAVRNLRQGRPILWIHFEGDFDLDRLELGMRTEGAHVRRKGEEFTAHYEATNPMRRSSSLRVQVNAKQVIVQALDFGQAGGEAYANMLLKQGLDLDADVAFLRLPEQSKKAEPEDLTQIVRSLTIRMPEEGASALRLHAVMQAEETAAMVSDWLSKQPAKLGTEGEKNQLILKLLNALAIEQKGRVLDFNIAIGDIDIAALGRWVLARVDEG